MKLLRICPFLVLVVLLFTGCDNDDNSPDKKITNSFKSMYPDASRVEWEQKGNFYIADFYSENKEKEAWFNIHGTWVQTITDLSYNDLPEAIKNAIDDGDYNSWKIEDTDYLERKGFEPVYVMEMEQGERDAHIYYLEDGSFIKAFSGPFDKSSYPNSVSTISDILKFVSTKYKDSKIGSVEIKTSSIEVDFIHEGLLWQMYLNRDMEWIETSRNALWAEIPPIVKNSLDENNVIFDENSGKVKKMIRPVKTIEKDKDGKEVVIESEITIYQIQPDGASSTVVYFTEDGEIWKEN